MRPEDEDQIAAQLARVMAEACVRNTRQVLINDDLDAYHPPEMLPNGDIIIRRKTPLYPDGEPGDEVDI